MEGFFFNFFSGAMEDSITDFSVLQAMVIAITHFNMLE